VTDKTEQDIFRGEQAARLLSDPTLQEALSTIEQEFTEQWKNSPARDAEGREKLFLMVKTVNRFRMELENVLQTGQLAKLGLAQRLGKKLSPFY
jgi:hypothetical protein